MSDVHTSVDELIERCRSHGMRRTPALFSVLQLLLKSERPLTANEIVESTSVEDRVDPATIYRMLVRLEEHAVVRRLGFHGRAAYYTIRHAHCHDDYIVCTQCGAIEELDIECPVEALESEIELRSGFRNLDHELEFFGVCPACAKPNAPESSPKQPE